MSESKIYTENEMCIVTPSKNNLHEIIAIDNTIFFDVLVPDYKDDNQCNYFKIVGSSNDGKGKFMLEKERNYF